MRQPMSAPWTEQQLALLLQFVRSGASPLRAAACLKRSLVSVKSRARAMGNPFPTAAQARRLREAKYAAAQYSAPVRIARDLLSDSKTRGKNHDHRQI